VHHKTTVSLGVIQILQQGRS